MRHKIALIAIIASFLFMGTDEAGPEEITKDRILESISLIPGWLLNNINPGTKTLQYLYSPAQDKYSKDNRHTRQIATLWGMTELRKFLTIDTLDNLINNTFAYYLAYAHTKDGYSFISVGDESNLAYNAFLILALLNSNHPQKTMLLERFASGILAMQKSDGSYRTDFINDTTQGVNYSPGEAMLALMKLYGETKAPAYIDSVKKAFTYYSDYWRNNKNAALIPWHTQACYLLYRETKDPALAEFIFEMNDWVVDNYQILESENADELGGFPKNNPRSCTTGAYLEGLNDAYAASVMAGDEFHKIKYAASIKAATGFILKTQYNPSNAAGLKNSKRAIGGFKKSLKKSSQRVDYTQHATNALIKAYKNNLFPESGSK